MLWNFAPQSSSVIIDDCAPAFQQCASSEFEEPDA